MALVVLSTAAFSIAALPPHFIVVAIIAAEAAANFSMVFVTGISRSAHRGMGSAFVDAMHERRGLRLIVSFTILLAISLIALSTVGLVVAVGAPITAMIMAIISSRHFDGITGDVMGATNEISRTVSLLLIVVLLK